jgi:N-acetylmuramoyl-L-alanine amidase
MSSMSIAQPAVISAYSDLYQVAVEAPFDYHIERVMPPLETYMVTLQTLSKPLAQQADSPCVYAMTSHDSAVTFSLPTTCRINFIAHHGSEKGVYDISLATYDQVFGYNQDTQALISDAKSGAVSRRTLAKQAIDITQKQQQDPAATTKHVVVIDPGHGGGDSGAISYGLQEKTLVLAIAKQLQQTLNARGDYTVYLTRDSDAYVTLIDRVRYAEYHHADLLLSLHLDQAADRTIHGYRLYTLSESGAALASTRRPVNSQGFEALQVDLAQLTTTLSGMRFADLLDHALDKVTHTHVAIPQQAGFTILQSIEVPSVLVELGFISHDTEAKQFAEPSYQARVADAIANAVDRYFNQSSPAMSALMGAGKASVDHASL